MEYLIGVLATTVVFLLYDKFKSTKKVEHIEAETEEQGWDLIQDIGFNVGHSTEHIAKENDLFWGNLTCETVENIREGLKTLLKAIEENTTVMWDEGLEDTATVIVKNKGMYLEQNDNETELTHKEYLGIGKEIDNLKQILNL